jgi:chaperonin GroEL
MKKITFDGEARSKILNGVAQLAKTVKSTLGPQGCNVVIDKGNLAIPVITKDGVSVAREIHIPDRVENIGAQLVKNVANQTNDVAGDGTTTATVLAEAIYTEGLKTAAAGMSTARLKEGIEIATKLVIAHLNDVKVDVTDDMLEKIATISANNDSEIGKLIAASILKVGTDGTVRVENSHTSETHLTSIDGFQYDRGMISHYFCTDDDMIGAEYEDAFVLCYDGEIDNANDILPLLGNFLKTHNNAPLVIVCDDIKADALTTIVQNHLAGRLRVLPVKTPGFHESKQSMLEDVACITGAVAITANCGIKLDEASLDVLGKVKKIVATSTSTTIYGSVPKDVIDSRAKLVREQLASAKSEYAQFNNKLRLARLTTGISIINVGGANEVELKEKKDRIEDSLNATKAALKKGVVPGGGIALLRAGEAIKSKIAKMKLHLEVKAGVDIIINATKSPIRTICENGGNNGEVISNKVLEQSDVNYGYDARNEVYGDMFKAGVIDPVLVTMTALTNASSISALLLTTNAVITLDPEAYHKMKAVAESNN